MGATDARSETSVVPSSTLEARRVGATAERRLWLCRRQLDAIASVLFRIHARAPTTVRLRWARLWGHLHGGTLTKWGGQKGRTFRADASAQQRARRGCARPTAEWTRGPDPAPTLQTHLHRHRPLIARCTSGPPLARHATRCEVPANLQMATQADNEHAFAPFARVAAVRLGLRRGAPHKAPRADHPTRVPRRARARRHGPHQQ